jgi:hypothetical protein
VNGETPVTKEQQKYKIVSLLLNGSAPKDIAEELDVPYSTVLRTNRELKESQDNNTMQEFLDMDAVLMGELMDAAVERTPEMLKDDMKSSLANLNEAKTGMEILSAELQITAKALVIKIKSLSMGIEHVSEIESLASALCQLQNAFFNKNQTQVNVQNNFGNEGSPKYGAFLSDKPSNN